MHPLHSGPTDSGPTSTNSGPRVLVTGAAGYIGSTLVRQLLDAGYQVLAVDRMYFGEIALAELATHPAFTLLRSDVCTLHPAHLQGIHAVLDLAAISNDPAAELDPRWTDNLNHRARVRLARLARDASVPRYVLVSSCSVYGRASVSEVDEASPVDPLTEYSRAGVLAERAILALGTTDFAPCAVRLGTVYGHSHRMRFDIVVNTMTLSASRRGVLTLHGGGRQWRPHVHVQDVGRALLATLRTPSAALTGQIFNIGETNLRIREVAETISQVFHEHLGQRIEIRSDRDSPDLRNYRVNFDKARDMLAFNPLASMESAIAQLAHGIQAGSIEDSPTTYTTNWYRSLLELGIVSELATAEV
jgi:nucleoside-diphosphate-sugar epimerase